LISHFGRFVLAGVRNQQPKIELRKDVPRPYWRLRLFVPTPDGMRRRNFNVGFRDETTRKQANKHRLELLAKVNRGELHDSGGMKFSGLAERFRELRLPSLKASTQALYQQHLKHLLPAFGDYELEQITRLRIEQFLASKSSLSWWTRRGILTVLSAVLGAAVEWRALDHNTAIGIKLPKKTEKNPKTIPSSEQLRLVTEALDASTGLLIRLLAVTGLRISEVIALKWSDVDWQRQTITVKRRWYRGNMDTPKSVASVRPQWIGPLIGELGRLKPAQDCFIFGGEQPIDERNELREKLRPALRSIGLPVGTGWHCFRRLHASLLQQAGASSIETSKLVGLVAINTTADYTIIGQAREAELVGSVCERLLLA
jgi:integrase